LSRSQSKSSSKPTRKNASDNTAMIVPTSTYAQLHSRGKGDLRTGKSAVAGNHQLERIQKIAAELFASKGYRAVGVAELGGAVGLGRGALYYHISSKEDLLFRIVVRYIEDLVSAGRDAIQKEPDPKKRVYVLSRQLLHVIFENLPEMTVCFREADCLTGQRHRIVSGLHQLYQDIWATTLREGETKGIFKPLPTVAIKGILGMYFYSFLWLKPGGKKSPVDIADLFADMVVAIAESKTSKGAKPS